MAKHFDIIIQTDCSKFLPFARYSVTCTLFCHLQIILLPARYSAVYTFLQSAACKFRCITHYSAVFTILLFANYSTVCAFIECSAVCTLAYSAVCAFIARYCTLCCLHVLYILPSARLLLSTRIARSAFCTFISRSVSALCCLHVVRSVVCTFFCLHELLTVVIAVFFLCYYE